MRKDSNIIIRVDSSLKGNVMKILEKKGYTLSDAINAFLKDVERKGQLPINLNKFLPTPKHEGPGYINIAFIKMCLDEIMKSYGKDKVQKVYLFGSFARGEETSSSDVDLRIEPGEKLNLIDLGNIRLDLVQKLNRDVDLLACFPKDMDKAFYDRVRKEEICLYVV